MPTTPKPASAPGVSGPCPAPASQAVTPGREIAGNTAAHPPGLRDHTIPRPTYSIGAPVTRDRTMLATCERDNLYADCLIALDPDTGKLKWYFQFTPHDVNDIDANEIPVLVDAVFRGKPRKLVLFGNRNGFYYILDRLTGEFLLAKQFATQTWAKGLDERGRPIPNPA